MHFRYRRTTFLQRIVRELVEYLCGRQHPSARRRQHTDSDISKTVGLETPVNVAKKLAISLIYLYDLSMIKYPANKSH
jgi:hypothetical protein